MSTSMEQAIVQVHGARLAGFAAQPTPPSTDEHGAVYRAALAACSKLGFIAADAHCIAQAWRAQTARTGTFDAAHWPDAPEDFGLLPHPRAAQFARCPRQLGLYAVLPDARWVRRMAQAGVPTLQLRFKSTDHAAVVREVTAAIKAIGGTASRLFINDHWREAIDAGAYGVHLGQEDLSRLSNDETRALRDSGCRLGISTHGYAEMVLADHVGPSYIAIGAIFPTTLKPMPTVPQGLARLHDYARLMAGYPLVAIGGITQASMPDVLAHGVGSVAVVRAITQSPDPEASARQLMQIINRASPAA